VPDSRSLAESSRPARGLANQRCTQENLIDQLKNGGQAMRMPVDDQTSSWALPVRFGCNYVAMFSAQMKQWHRNDDLS
jgi:hypothetical protein